MSTIRHRKAILLSVLVIKTLPLPILIQSLTVLLNSLEWPIKEIKDIFYNFLWNGKNDKIKRTVMINRYEVGCLRKWECHK